MRVGFWAMGEGPHLDCARYLVESVKFYMPGVEVSHITDAKTPRSKWADRIVRVGADVPMAMKRIMAHATLPGEWLYIDTDCILRRDVRLVLEDDFDVALTDRVGSIYEHGPYGKLMPYNMGVTFSKNPKFWGEVLSRMSALQDSYKEWEGDQLVVGMLAKEWPKVKILPGHVFNYSPDKRGDKAEHAAIVHLKGNRKGWMEDYAVRR
jgi:hypothetical protein